ncbi:hypothetical protein L1887_56954 [Cichorium endivia]|nr:hypothetical protein L1887_56954 [Cichorium endivia]
MMGMAADPPSRSSSLASSSASRCSILPFTTGSTVCAAEGLSMSSCDGDAEAIGSGVGCRADAGVGSGDPNRRFQKCRGVEVERERVSHSGCVGARDARARQRSMADPKKTVAMVANRQVTCNDQHTSPTKITGMQPTMCSGKRKHAGDKL